MVLEHVSGFGLATVLVWLRFGLVLVWVSGLVYDVDCVGLPVTVWLGVRLVPAWCWA